MTMTSNRFALGAAALYAFAWAGSTAYLAHKGADWIFPVIAMAVFGMALSGLAWALTRNSGATAPRVANPGRQTLAVGGFLILYVLIFLLWGLSAVREAAPDGRIEDSAVLALKLVVHVAAPAALLLALHDKPLNLFRSDAKASAIWAPLIVIGAILIGLLAVVSPSLRNIAALAPSAAVLAWAAPLSFIWIALEAGLCEEFLFRAVVQTRLQALTRSHVGAVVITSTVFALAHAPGLYLRGDANTDGWSTDPFQVMAFTVATLSPLSLLFGVLWARTRSLFLCVVLHACVDFLPNLPDFLRTWA